MAALDENETGQVGADVRNRTADLLITSELLYQLSYVGQGTFTKESRSIALPQPIRKLAEQERSQRNMKPRNAQL